MTVRLRRGAVMRMVVRRSPALPALAVLVPGLLFAAAGCTSPARAHYAQEWTSDHGYDRTWRAGLDVLDENDVPVAPVLRVARIR